MCVKNVIIEGTEKFEILGSRSDAPEDSSLVGRDAVSLGKDYRRCGGPLNLQLQWNT
jgi:hypothetical protein